MKDTKAIIFSQHAMEQLFDRGATENEVEQTIREGEELPAKKARRNMPQSHGVHGEKKNQNSILCGLCVSVATLQICSMERQIL